MVSSWLLLLATGAAIALGVVIARQAVDAAGETGSEITLAALAGLCLAARSAFKAPTGSRPDTQHQTDTFPAGARSTDDFGYGDGF
jgi:hypothetical protein